jgi:hypothetical protein
MADTATAASDARNFAMAASSWFALASTLKRAGATDPEIQQLANTQVGIASSAVTEANHALDVDTMVDMDWVNDGDPAAMRNTPRFRTEFREAIQAVDDAETRKEELIVTKKLAVRNKEPIANIFKAERDYALHLLTLRRARVIRESFEDIATYVGVVDTSSDDDDDDDDDSGAAAAGAGAGAGASATKKKKKTKTNTTKKKKIKAKLSSSRAAKRARVGDS